jgi:hypothetical protein
VLLLLDTVLRGGGATSTAPTKPTTSEETASLQVTATINGPSESRGPAPRHPRSSSGRGTGEGAEKAPETSTTGLHFFWSCCARASARPSQDGPRRATFFTIHMTKTAAHSARP